MRNWTPRTPAVALLVILALSLLIAACGGAAATPSPTKPPAATPTVRPASTVTPVATLATPATPTPAPTPTKQPASTPTPGRTAPAGELVLASGEGDSTLGLVSTKSEINARLWQQLQFEWLVDRDSKGALAPGLATEWKLSNDLSYWEFKLRKGVKFQDGQEMTAEDWVAMEPLYAAGTGGTAPKIKSQVSKWEAPDPYTLRLYTKGPQVTLMDQISRAGILSLFVTSKKFVQEKGVAYWEANPIGSGPYNKVDRKPGASVTYQVTPEAAGGDHWRVKNPGFAKVTVSLVLESTTRVAMLQTGTADIVDIRADQKAQVADKPGVRIENARRVTTTGLALYGQGIPGAYFNDIRVRKALNLAVNVDQIVDKIYKGEAARIPHQGVTEDVLGWVPSLKPYPYDPQQAKQLLKEANFPPAGFTLEIWGSSTKPNSESEAVEAVASSWQSLGVNVQMRPTDSYTVYTGRIKDRTFVNRVFTRSNTNSPDPSSVWMSGMACLDKFGPLLGFRTSCGEVDDWIGQFFSEPDPAKRQALATKVHTWFNEQYIMVPLVAFNKVYAFGPKVGQFKLLDNTRYADPLELIQRAK